MNNLEAHSQLVVNLVQDDLSFLDARTSLVGSSARSLGSRVHALRYLLDLIKLISQIVQLLDQRFILVCEKKIN